MGVLGLIEAKNKFVRAEISQLETVISAVLRNSQNKSSYYDLSLRPSGSYQTTDIMTYISTIARTHIHRPDSWLTLERVGRQSQNVLTLATNTNESHVCGTLLHEFTHKFTWQHTSVCLLSVSVSVHILYKNKHGTSVVVSIVRIIK